MVASYGGPRSRCVDLSDGRPAVESLSGLRKVSSVRRADPGCMGRGQPLLRPQGGMGVEHPSPFSAPILRVLGRLVPEGALVLDPFAGIGRIHTIPGLCTWGVEIEPEWASVHPRTLVGDALDLPFRDGVFDAVVTSPTYGNRMADHHEARDASKRITYKHKLGRPLHPHNSGQMQWGRSYRVFHQHAWLEACRVLRSGGLLILNASDHWRKSDVQPVVMWHRAYLESLGLECIASVPVQTRRMGYGANGRLRVPYEYVLVFRHLTPSQQRD